MCGNAFCCWYEEENAKDGVKCFGVDSEPGTWLGKLEPDGNEFRWTYCFIDGVALTGKVVDEELGREVIEAFQQALDLAEGFAVCDMAATSNEERINPADEADENKKQLLEMARKEEPRPRAQKTQLGQALGNYTRKSDSSYNPKFDKEIRELAPHWFVNA